MPDATVNVPNPQTGSPAAIDGVAATANGGAFRQAAAIKSADGSDNGVVIGADSLLPTKTVANGVYDYRGGSSGSPRAIGATQRVVTIAAHATASGAYVTINGGDQIPVPPGNGISLSPNGNLTSPALVFSNTDSYYVELST